MVGEVGWRVVSTLIKIFASVLHTLNGFKLPILVGRDVQQKVLADGIRTSIM